MYMFKTWHELCMVLHSGGCHVGHVHVNTWCSAQSGLTYNVLHSAGILLGLLSDKPVSDNLHRAHKELTDT